MTPKIRNPFTTWLLTGLTSGIYLYFWVWLVSSEINSAEKRVVFPVQRWRNLLIILIGLTVIVITETVYVIAPNMDALAWS